MSAINQPDITVVLCTRNRAEMLRDALLSLGALKTDGQFTYEVLVVDNGSTDHTCEVIQAAAADLPTRSIWEGALSLPVARNRGVREARGAWIAFFDDDQLADTHWLLELWRVAREKNASCAGGAVRLKLPVEWNGRLRPLSRMLLGETPVGETPIRYTTRFTPGTGNLMIHRQVFEQIGLFDDAFRLRNEDTELFLRIEKAGIAGWYNPAARVEHVIPLSRLRWRYMARLSQQSSQMIPQLDWQDRGGAWVFPLLWAARWIRAGGNMLKDLPSASLRRDPGAWLEICSRLGTIIGYSQAAFKLYRRSVRPLSENIVANAAAWHRRSER